MTLLHKIKHHALTVSAAVLALAMITTGVVSAANKKDVKPTTGLMISPATNSIELAPKQVYKGQMTVKNTSTIPMDFKIGSGSYTIVNNNYSAPNYDKVGKYSLMKDWISVDKSELHGIPAGKTAVVNYTIKVPDNPPAGTQYATLFASTVLPTQDKSATTSVKSSARVGMVISASMKGGKTVDRNTIEKQSIPGYQPQAPLKSSFTIKNEGNVAAAVNYSMEVHSWLDNRLEFQGEQQQASVYPETSRDFDMTWTQMRTGIYKVKQKVSVNGRDHSIEKVVVSVPIWIFVLAIIGILLIAVFTAINVKGIMDARKRNNKSAKSHKATSRKGDK